ncbi:MAG: hypothetical protein WC132_04570 [Methanomethylophilus sp.]|jgi:hypothetical protein
MAVEYLDKGNDDGTCFGQDTSEKISFFGATPSAQVACTNVSTTNTIGVVKTRVKALIVELKAKGLIG